MTYCIWNVENRWNKKYAIIFFKYLNNNIFILTMMRVPHNKSFSLCFCASPVSCSEWDDLDCVHTKKRRFPFISDKTHCGTAATVIDESGDGFSGTWSWSRLNFSVAAVRFVLQLPVTPDGDPTPELQDSTVKLMSRYFNYVNPPPCHAVAAQPCLLLSQRSIRCERSLGVSV